MRIYSFLLYCAAPLIILRLLWRGFKAPEYWRRWPERFGFFSFKCDEQIKNKKTVCLHAVSVGEVLAAKPLVEFLLENRPDIHLVITCTTPTGSHQITRLFGGRVFHVYLPYDFPGSVKRFLKKIKPSLFLIMETEVWPTMVTACHTQQIPLVLVNARLSERSLKRYQSFSTFASSIFKKFNRICAQSDADAMRFAELSTDNVIATGNIKSDIHVSADLLRDASQYKQALLGDTERLILIAASTHKGEDEIMLRAYSALKAKFPSLLLVLVPRHPERFDSVASLCEQSKLCVIRKSSKKTLDENTDVLLGDTMGELFMLYGISDVTIMGGTFVDRGGHNFLEPAAWGRPMLSGKSVYNFSVIASELENLDALGCVDDQALAVEVGVLLGDENVRREKGLKAKQYLEQKKGALNNTIKVIEPLLNSSS